MTPYQLNSKANTSKWSRCFIAQPTLGAVEGDNREGVE
jgi:hypothetical protein